MGLDIDVLYMPYHPYILSHDHILLFLLLIMVMKNLDKAEVKFELMYVEIKPYFLHFDSSLNLLFLHLL